MLRAYELVAAAASCAMARVDAGRDAAVASSPSGYLFDIVPKGFFPIEDTGLHLRHHRGGAGHLLRRRWRAISSAGRRRSSRPIPTSTTSTPTIGATGFSPALNNGRIFIELKPRERARASAPIEVIQQLRREVGADHRHQRLLPEPCRTSSSAAGSSKSTLSIHAPGRQPGRALPLRAAAAGAASPQLPGFQDVNSDLQLRNRTAIVDIDRDKAAQLGITARPDQEHALQRLRHAPDLDDLSAGERLSGHPGGRSALTSSDPTDLSQHLSARSPTASRCRWRPSRRCARASARSRSTTRASFPSVTISFNLAPGVSLGEAVDRHRAASSAASICRSRHHDRLPGHRAGLPGVAARARACCSSPPCSSSTSCSAFSTRASSTRSRFCPACRRPALGALLTLHAVPHGSERHRHHRHHHADRHRQEERDHDDRLRARAAAQPATRRRRRRSIEACLLRFRPIMMTTMAAIMGGLPIALGLGAGAELRQPLGPRRRRRPRRVAVADAVHHAGDLSLSRAARGGSSAAARRAEPRRRRARCAVSCVQPANKAARLASRPAAAALPLVVVAAAAAAQLARSRPLAPRARRAALRRTASAARPIRRTGSSDAEAWRNRAAAAFRPSTAPPSRSRASSDFRGAAQRFEALATAMMRARRRRCAPARSTRPGSPGSSPTSRRRAKPISTPRCSYTPNDPDLLIDRAEAFAGAAAISDRRSPISTARSTLAPNRADALHLSRLGLSLARRRSTRALDDVEHGAQARSRHRCWACWSAATSAGSRATTDGARQDWRARRRAGARHAPRPPRPRTISTVSRTAGGAAPEPSRRALIVRNRDRRSASAAARRGCGRRGSGGSSAAT